MEDECLGFATILPVGEDGASDSFELDLPAANGMDYLRRVRHEAKNCPSTVTVTDIPMKENKGNRQPSGKGIAQSIASHNTPSHSPAPAGYIPDVAWQKKQVSNFSNVRMAVVKKIKKWNKEMANQELPKLPKSGDAEGWCQLCFGHYGADAQQRTDEQSAENVTSPESGTPPLLSLVSRLDQTTLLAVLEYHINWFEATGFTQKQGEWLYALLALLEKPLLPEACSLIRMLARHCSNLRASLDSPSADLLPQLNLLICIVARYFDQTDLVDEYPI